MAEVRGAEESTFKDRAVDLMKVMAIAGGLVVVAVGVGVDVLALSGGALYNP